MDGYDPSTKTVYKFHGCEFHGCKNCKPNNRHSKTFHHPDRTVEEMYQATQQKTRFIRAAGYVVVEMWECTFKKELKQNEELQDLVRNMTWVSLLDTRDAFYGGRSGMAKCYHTVEEGEQIDTLGHPQIIVNSESQNIQDYFGIAKVDMLAPEKLLHLVLPVKLNGKLMFPLCVKCIEDQMDRPWHKRTNLCNHTEEERVMKGTWCTHELQKAVELGYRIVKIH